MDPVSLEQLFRELRSVGAESVDILSAELTPGRVIAAGSRERHIVTGPARPHFVSGTLTFPVRHLHGGHDVPYVVGDTAPVRVYAAHVAPSAVSKVPVVPPCVIPDNPAVGDRIVLQPYNAHAFGVVVAREFTGEHWRALPGGGGTLLRTSVMREEVSPPMVGSLGGWYVYLPAGQQPRLYADGRPVPARGADELAVGDVMLIPGGGRFQIERVHRHPDGFTLSLRVLTPSVHEMRHLAWAQSEGDIVEHHDSGLRGYLYATEPRAEEQASPAAAPAFQVA